MAPSSICDSIKAISDDKSLVLFNTVALASGNTGTLNTALKLTRKQYYSRTSNLINAGLVTKRNGKYFLTSFGKIVYEAQMIIGKAIELYWKLKAIDSFQTSSANPQLPAEEYNRIIDTLLEGKNEIKNILFRHNNNDNNSKSAAAQKEHVYNNREELIVSAQGERFRMRFNTPP